MKKILVLLCFILYIISAHAQYCSIKKGRTAYYVTTEEVTKEVVDTSAYKYVLATSCAIGGSYAAVILKKVA